MSETPGPESPVAAVVVLAAGEGTRMKSSRIAQGAARLRRPLAARPRARRGRSAGRGTHRRRRRAPPRRGHRAPGRDRAGRRAGRAGRAARHRPRRAARPRPPSPADAAAPSLVLPGDAPLLTAATLDARWSTRTIRRGAAATLLTSVLDDPTGYGRVIAGRRRRRSQRVVEHERRDRRPSARSARSPPSVYAFDHALLRDAVGRLSHRQRAGRGVPARRRRHPGVARRPSGRGRHRAGRGDRRRQRPGPARRRRTASTTPGCSRRTCAPASPSSIRPAPGSTPTSRSTPDATLLPSVDLHGATHDRRGRGRSGRRSASPTRGRRRRHRDRAPSRAGAGSARTRRSARSPTCARAPARPTACTSGRTSS